MKSIFQNHVLPPSISDVAVQNCCLVQLLTETRIWFCILSIAYLTSVTVVSNLGGKKARLQKHFIFQSKFFPGIDVREACHV